MNIPFSTPTIESDEVQAAPGYIIVEVADDQFESDRFNLGQELMYGRVVSLDTRRAYIDAANDTSYPEGPIEVGSVVGIARSKTIKLSSTRVPMYAAQLPFVICIVNGKEHTV